MGRKKRRAIPYPGGLRVSFPIRQNRFQPKLKAVLCVVSEQQGSLIRLSQQTGFHQGTDFAHIGTARSTRFHACHYATHGRHTANTQLRDHGVN